MQYIHFIRISSCVVNVIIASMFQYNLPPAEAEVIRDVKTSKVSEESQSIYRRIDIEARHAWALLDNNATSIRGEYSITREKQLSTGKVVSGRPVQYQFAANNNLVMERINKKRSKVIVAKNDHYAFGLTKSEGAKRFTLVWLERIGEAPAPDMRINQEVREALAMPRKSWHFLDKSMTQWLSDPNFYIKEASAVLKDDNKEFVRIDFETTANETNGRKTPEMKDAYIIFDPSNSWRITEYAINKFGSRESLITVNIIYNKDDRCVPFPQRIDYIAKSKDGLTVSKSTTSFTFLECKATSKEEFYLSHYGLPEPNFEEPFLSTWMKYLLAGLVCLGIAYWIKRRRAIV